MPDSPRPPRSSIFYVVGPQGIRGTERHLTQVVPRLQRLGWRPTVCCLQYKRPLVRLLAAVRARVQAEFSLDRCVESYDRLHLSLIAKRGGNP